MDIPVYLMTGFLDGGKTTFTQFTIEQDYFSDGSKNLLILCEDGEEEYDPVILEANHTTMVMVESEEKFTEQQLLAYQDKYQPERVIIEYNGMWRIEKILKMELPKGWLMNQIITLIDAGTFELYLNNMKSMVMEMVANSELVIFNRCTEDTKAASYKRSVKAVNRSAQIIFESENGEIAVEEELPYDLSKDRIDILDDDFGIWYIDALEHPDHYRGKIINFKAMVLKPPQFPKQNFIPGRMAMTCCADDITFIGFVCKGDGVEKLETKQWVWVSAKMKFEYQKAYQSEGPVLYADAIKTCEKPKEEIIYFN